MNNHRCLSQKSLITVRKWLLEGNDSLSPKSKSHVNKIVKRKRFYQKKFASKPRSIINWFYEFIKHIFTVCDESPLHDTTGSIITCSTRQLEYDYRRNNNSPLHVKTNSKSTQTETIENFGENHNMIPCNFLIGCHHSSRTNTNAPEIVFAESTCQLIKEAFVQTLHDQ